jgi:outer membrane biosynthesis protein TonB
MQKLENVRASSAVNKSSRQLFITKQNERVVEVKVLNLGQKYRGVIATASDKWIYHTDGAMQIQQKSVQLEDLNRFTHLSADQLIDEDSKKGVYAVLGVTALFLILALFGPAKQEELIMTDLPKVAQKITFKTDLNPRKKVAEQTVPKPTAPQKAAAPKPKVADTKQATGGKVANMLKSISGGRISQLIGKVSSQAAKSANVVITNGIKAGQGNSGRALASLGNVEKSGRNWGTESGGKDVVVSTAGRGGGKNASGMGGLAAGSTGSGGVGLIEEESEISGGLDRDIIAQYIKSQLGQILYCYERQLSASPDLFGKIAVKFTIGGNGAVEKQLIGDTTLKNATVEGCILNRVAAWKFPAPQGGTKVLVTYPFLFKSTN